MARQNPCEDQKEEDEDEDQDAKRRLLTGPCCS
jgi:hypothetical protein